ncbi:AI-2E family transporter [Chloroflexota bacterium]
MMKVSTQGRIFFYLLLAFVFWITYLLLKPYLGVVVFSMITVVIFKPVYDRILKWVGGRVGWATTLAIVVIFLAVLIPVLIVVNITFNQASLLVQDLSALVAGRNANFTTIINEVNEMLATTPFASSYQLSEAGILEGLRKMAGPVTNFVANQALSLGSASVEWITSVIIFLSVVATLFPTYDKAIQLLKDLSPLPDELDQMYVNRFVAMTKAMFKGIFVIAIIQGIVAGIFMAVAGTGYVFFLTLLAIFVAVLPLGVNILTIPVGIAHFFLGNTWQGVLIIAASVLIVSQIDNLVRPRLVTEEAYLNPALVLLSAFGGLIWFGFLGVIYGPIIAIFFVTTIEIYLKYYRISAPEVSVTPAQEEAEQETKQQSETPA